MAYLWMQRISTRFHLTVLLIIIILMVPFTNSVKVNAQTPAGVVTTKSISPSCAVPGQRLTVDINISVTGGVVSEPLEVVLAIDKTGSMYGERYQDAKAAAEGFIDAQHNDDLAEVISFAQDLKLEKDITVTNSSGKVALDSAILNIMSPLGYTNLYAAFNKSITDLMAKGRPGFKKVVILMTDGDPHWGITAEPPFIQLAQSAAAANIGVYCIGLGPGGAYSYIDDPVNQTLLQDIAKVGSGKYYYAPSSSDLAAIYVQINAQLNQPPPAENIRVTENLPTSIVTYNNDATQAPNSTSSGVIFWQIPLISAGTSWSVTFTVTAQRRVAVVQSISPTTIIYDRAGQVGITADLPPGMTVREVSTLTMTASRTTATQGDVVNYNATIANLGLMPETFNVGLFANTTSIGLTSVTLANGTSTVVHFSWNTSSFSPGTYDVSITADPDSTISCDEPSNNTKTTTLTLASKPQAAIFPLLLPILLPIALIPIVAAATLGRRRRILPGAPAPCPSAGTVTSSASCRIVCPRCYGPLTYSANYQKWYCPSCRRYV